MPMIVHRQRSLRNEGFSGEGLKSLPLAQLVRHRLRDWPVESQQGSRRNAMIASTALAQRRAEREDVEHFLASRAREAEPRVSMRG